MITCTDIKYGEHGVYEAKWSYANAEAKYSGFFPDRWSRAKVISKIEEALRNQVKEPYFENG